MRTLRLLMLGALVGCEGSTALPVPLLDTPDELLFDGVPLGETQQRALPIHNLGTATADAVLSVEGPFTLSSPFAAIEPDSTSSIGVYFEASSVEPAEGWVRIAVGTQTHEVALFATVQAR
jgi:hypothetical protein